MNKYPLLENSAREMIDQAKVNGHSVITTLDGFNTKHDLLILRDLLRYASDQGVQVIFDPRVKRIKV